MDKKIFCCVLHIQSNTHASFKYIDTNITNDAICNISLA